MKLADVVTAFRRRWYIVLAAILVAAGASYYLWTNIPPEYERTGTQLLLPGLATIPEDANPYLYVGGLFQVTDVLVRAVGAEDIEDAAQDFPGTNVAVTRDQAAGAVVIVTVTASSDVAAEAVLDDMLVVTERTLEKLQDEQNIPPAERVSLTPLTKSLESEVIQKTRLVTTAIVGGVLLVAGLAIAVLVDNLLRSRRRAHRSSVLPDKDDDDVRLDDEVIPVDEAEVPADDDPSAVAAESRVPGEGDTWDHAIPNPVRVEGRASYPVDVDDDDDRNKPAPLADAASSPHDDGASESDSAMPRVAVAHHHEA